MNTQNITDSTILDCEHVPSPHSEFTTGYGVDNSGKVICYECCATECKEYMREHGRITLYLVKQDNGYHVTNWPGTLDFKLNGVKTGHHNIAGKRYDIWFAFDGYYWHGTQYGDNTQLCHCKRTKDKAYFQTSEVKH